MVVKTLHFYILCCPCWHLDNIAKKRGEEKKMIFSIDIMFCFLIDIYTLKILQVYRKSSIKRRGAYSILDYFTVALIRGRRLFECGAYSNKNQKFQTNDFSSVKELIFLHPRPYLLRRQNQVADLARTHFQYRIHSPGMDQFQVF